MPKESRSSSHILKKKSPLRGLKYGEEKEKTSTKKKTRVKKKEKAQKEKKRGEKTTRTRAVEKTQKKTSEEKTQENTSEKNNTLTSIRVNEDPTLMQTCLSLGVGSSPFGKNNRRNALLNIDSGKQLKPGGGNHD